MATQNPKPALKLKDLTIDNIQATQTDPNFWYNIFDKRIFGFQYVNHSPEIFNILATDKTSTVISYVIGNPHTPKTALTLIVNKITQSEDNWLKNKETEIETLIKHPQITQPMIEKLLTKKYTHTVIAKTFTNKTPLPENFFQQLTKSEIASVHTQLARNIHTPPNILYKYGQQSIKELSTPPEKKNIWDKSIYDTISFHISITKNPATTQKILTQYEHILQTYGLPLLVTRELANNPNTPQTLLTKLATTRDRYTKQNLLQNPSTTPEIITNIWKETITKRDYKTILYVLKHEKIPKIIKQKAKIFYTTQADKIPKHLHYKNITPTKEDYIATLTPHYPEITNNLPLEWLTQLAKGLQLRHYRITPKELNHPTRRTTNNRLHLPMPKMRQNPRFHKPNLRQNHRRKSTHLPIPPTSRPIQKHPIPHPTNGNPNPSPRDHIHTPPQKPHDRPKHKNKTLQQNQKHSHNKNIRPHNQHPHRQQQHRLVINPRHTQRRTHIYRTTTHTKRNSLQILPMPTQKTTQHN